MAKDPSKIADKWARKLADAVQDYKDGITSTTDNPMLLAADKAATAKARYAKSIDDGSWAASLRGTPKNVWTDNAVGVGAGRLADGATKGKPKQLRYHTKAAPAYAAARAEIRAMPNSTDAERKARMDRNLQLMKDMKGIGRR